MASLQIELPLYFLQNPTSYVWYTQSAGVVFWYPLSGWLFETVNITILWAAGMDKK